MSAPDKIDPGTVDQSLAASSSPWVREGDRIVLVRRFDTFPEAVAFVDRVADHAEAADHHPDIEIHYAEVRLVLWTHVSGGITQRDLDLAATIAADAG